MALYDVPQTSDASDAAMAALIARLRASAPKPEAITAGASTDATLAVLLFKWVGRVGSALGQRATLPILQWDGALDGACIDLAARDYYNKRGRERGKGADTSIDAVADDALAYLARLAPAGDADGKTENPQYVDSGDNEPLDRARFNYSTRSDGWIGKHRRNRR
jgi:hypothetical protein